MIAFESAGDVNLLFFDSQAGAQVVTNYGAGYNPFIVTDTYIRSGDSADSERLLFYVNNTTKQIVYRKQLDRFTIEYTLPDAPQDIVELIKVSKNIYGGITALYCYDDGAGGLLTGSFTAKMIDNQVDPGTDGFQKSKVSLVTSVATFVNFSLAVKGLQALYSDSLNLLPTNANLSGFFLGQKVANIFATDTPDLSFGTADLVEFLLEFVPPPEIYLLVDTGNLENISFIESTLISFSLKETILTLNIDASENITNIAITSATLTSFSLG